MYYQGYYHLFYQYNPDGAVWGNIVWGHAVSTDLVNWRHLQNALQGDQWYDIKGIWSGSATILADGTPVLMYTGWSSDSSQVQNMAIPVDKTDPLLRKWTKVCQSLIQNPHNADQLELSFNLVILFTGSWPLWFSIGCLAPLGMPKRIWPSMNWYRIYFV